MKIVPLFKVGISPTVGTAIQRVCDSGYINEGTQVNQLRQELVPHIGSKLIMTNSGTSALTLAYHMCARPGTCATFLTTPMTCVASNTPIVNLGHKIGWVDVNPLTGMPDLLHVKEAHASHPEAVAVVLVAWAGTPPRELELIDQYCEENGLKLIIDAAHAFGAKHDGLSLSYYGDFVAYSFQAIKHFTTGDGGALVINEIADYSRANRLKWFGLDRDQAKDAKGDWKGQQWDVDIVEAGYKFNMNNVAAAIGLENLPMAISRLSVHRKNAIDLFLNLHVWKHHVNLDTVTQSSNWVFTVVVGEESLRDHMLSVLNENGIKAGLVHVPNDDYTAFVDYKRDLPGVRQFSSRQFSLPCGWWVEQEDLDKMIEIVNGEV